MSKKPINPTRFLNKQSILSWKRFKTLGVEKERRGEEKRPKEDECWLEVGENYRIWEWLDKMNVGWNEGRKEYGLDKMT